MDTPCSGKVLHLNSFSEYHDFVKDLTWSLHFEKIGKSWEFPIKFKTMKKTGILLFWPISMKNSVTNIENSHICLKKKENVMKLKNCLSEIKLYVFLFDCYAPWITLFKKCVFGSKSCILELKLKLMLALLNIYILLFDKKNTWKMPWYLVFKYV